MIANPGFSAQRFLPEVLLKIRHLRAIRAEPNLHPTIEVNGGENAATAERAAAAGVTALVAGSAVFGTENYLEAILRARVEAAAAQS